MRHSAMLIYLASISPSPEISISMGAFFRISVSPMMTRAQAEGRETFSPPRVMEEVAEA